MAEKKPAEAEKKSSKKIVLLTFVVLLLLAAGGGGYYFFMADSPEAEQEAEKKANSKSEKSSQDEPATAAYYDLGSPLVVNFPAGSSARIVKIAVSILLKDEASVEIVKKHEPMIRNNLLMVISSMEADQMKTLEGKEALREMMISEIGKVIENMAGRNTAQAVFFTEFVMQ